MEQSARAVVIGAGFAGAQHVEALRRIGVEVRAVVGSDPDRARSAADRLGVERSSADAAALIREDETDVVHVCVPNALHAPLVRLALEAGKHVICEKPLATTVADADELSRLAERSPCRAVLCHNYRFYPMVAEMRLRIASAGIGRVHLVRGAYLQDWLLDPRTTSWRVDPIEGGASRAVADIGTHWIDLAENVTGLRAESVIARLATVHPRRPGAGHVSTFGGAADGEPVEVRTEDEAVILVRFADGVLGSVTLSQVAAGHHNDLHLAVDGEEGSAEWRQERPDQLVLASGASREVFDRDPRTLRAGAEALASLPAGHGEGWADALTNLLRAAYASFAGTRSQVEEAAAPLPTFADGVRHTAFVEAVLRSHATGQWTDIATVLHDATNPAATEVHP